MGRQEGAQLGFWRPRRHPDRNAPGAGLFQRSRAFRKGRARCHHIIDQHHVLERGAFACRDPAGECPLDIAPAPGRIESGMGACASPAPQNGTVHRYSQCFPRLPGQEVSLVERPGKMT